MNDNEIVNSPKVYKVIKSATLKANFEMASDNLVCNFLKTLAATKPSGRFLELGTGTGLSTAWILDGMDEHSSLDSFDNDGELLQIAQEYLGEDTRLSLHLSDGEEWLLKHKLNKYDFIFADTWHGKYLMLDETIDMLKEGGIYIIDDMLPQENWPEEHEQKAYTLVKTLEKRKDLKLTKINWSTGLLIAVKTKTRD